MAVKRLKLLIILAVAIYGLCRDPLDAATPDFAVETIARGLDTPWAIDFAPDGRIFVSERAGRIRIIEHGQLRAEPWVTLGVASGSEAGLLGLALDPQFPQNRFVYVAYSYSAGILTTRNRPVRLRDDPKTGRVSSIKFLSTTSPARAITTAAE